MNNFRFYFFDFLGIRRIGYGYLFSECRETSEIAMLNLFGRFIFKIHFFFFTDKHICFRVTSTFAQRIIYSLKIHPSRSV